MPDPLDGLNAYQRSAVTHPAGPLLVVGGPGTGKTHVLTRRVAWLVEQGTPAHAVLALTASGAAAERVRCRVEALVERPYDELSILSFGSWCARLLHEEALEASLDPFFSPVTRADRVALLLEHVDDLPLSHHEIRGNPAPLLAGLVARIDRLKADCLSAEDLRRRAESGLAAADGDPAARADAERELELAAVYAEHDRLLGERGALDSGDLVIRGERLLRERPGVRERVGRRFQHVLVDDLEDVTSAQAALLRGLDAPGVSLTVAGGGDGRAQGLSPAGLADLRVTPELADARRITLTRSHRCGQRILDAARAVVAGDDPAGREGNLRGRAGARAGEVRFWHCSSERAQAQAVAREAERLIAVEGVAPEEIAVLVRSVRDEGGAIASAVEERSVPVRLRGANAAFERAEVRDVLAWLRLLADPADSSAVVRALTRPPIELRSVDVARLTQLARRRKLDMVAATRAACDGPQLSPEGRDRALTFLRLHRAAALAFDSMRPDAFVHRLVERIGLRRQQLYATQADTAERLVNIAGLSDLAIAYMRREPDAGARDFVRHLVAVAEAGVRDEDEESPRAPTSAVEVTTMRAARGREYDHVLVVGLDAAHMPGRPSDGGHGEPQAGRPEHEQAMRRLAYVAMTRARRGLVLSWAERAAPGAGAAARPSPFLEQARPAVGGEWERVEEDLFGPAEGLHSTFRMMRDELLDQVARVGGRLAEMRLDTYLDVAQAGTRYLELLKIAALIERQKQGQAVSDALPEVNDVLLQGATEEQRELFETSALDDYLREGERDERRRGEALGARSEPSLESFLPRRGEGLMLSASDIETYRLCPLKYKFARVFRVPQEPTINQRFGIVVHQVLERFHAQGSGSLDELMQLFEASWRRSGFGDRSDDRQFRARAVAALERYWEADREDPGEPVWFERSFSFKLGPHLVRGRVDRVDRLPDGGYELIDYKTGKPKTAAELSEDVQLSLYQMGARESWRLPSAAQSYLYVLDGEKVPVSHSEEELERVRGTVGEVADGILDQRFEPTPSYEICSFCDYRIACPAAER